MGIMTMIVGMMSTMRSRIPTWNLFETQDEKYEEEGFTSMNSGIMDYDNDCGNEDEKIK